MDNKMFCFQCEQTAACTACTGAAGVCGKPFDVAFAQDELTGALVGVRDGLRGERLLIEDGLQAEDVRKDEPEHSRTDADGARDDAGLTPAARFRSRAAQQ